MARDRRPSTSSRRWPAREKFSIHRAGGISAEGKRFITYARANTESEITAAGNCYRTLESHGARKELGPPKRFARRAKAGARERDGALPQARGVSRARSRAGGP